VQQYPVNKYRVDFALPAVRLAIEIDGHAWHSDSETFVNDRVRQRGLERDGWRFIRFAGREAINDPLGCVREAAALAGVFFPSLKRRSLFLSVGDLVSHTKYGQGVVIETEGTGARANATMDFADHGLVRLMLIGGVPLIKIGPECACKDEAGGAYRTPEDDCPRCHGGG
jgi:hypothetical protein